MTKIITSITIATLVATSSYAQGLVSFSSSTQNQSTNNVTGGEVVTDSALGNATAGKTVNVASSFYCALFFSASQATTVSGSSTAHQGGAAESLLFGASGWAFSGIYGANTTTAGRFAALGTDSNGASTVNGLAAGGSATFVILGWSANLGSTLAAVAASLSVGAHGYLGQSVVSGVIQSGDGALITTPALMSSGAPGIQSLMMGVVARR